MKTTWLKPVSCAILCALVMGCGGGATSGRSIAEATERFEALGQDSTEIERRLIADGGAIALDELPPGRATFSGVALVIAGTGDFLSDTVDEDVQIQSVLIGEMSAAVNFDTTTMTGTARDFVALANADQFNEPGAEIGDLASSGDVTGELTLKADAFGGELLTGPLSVTGTLRPSGEDPITLDARGEIGFGGEEAGFLTTTAAGINEIAGGNVTFTVFSGIAEQ